MNSAGVNHCEVLFLENFVEETFAKKAKNCKSAKISSFK